MHRQHLLTLLLLFLASLTVTAQDGIVFGRVSPGELSMQTYEADTTANAIILYEKGNAAIRLNRMGHPALFYEYLVRLKIFNANGMDAATVKVPLYISLSDDDRKERLEKVEGIVVNPDRTSGRVSEKDVFYEDIREDLTIATFTFPNVQEGAVIDYRYEVQSPFFYNFQTWEFQGDLPKLYSEYNTSIPANYQYNIKLLGPLKLRSHDTSLKRDCFTVSGLGSADCSVNRYIMDNIPAFREEKYMTAKVNYLSALRFEMTTFQDFRGMTEHYSKTWKTVDRELRSENIGREALKDGWFKNNLPDDLLAANPDKQKAQSIYDLVREQLYWNGKDHLFRDFSVKDTWKEGSGSSTAINMVLLNMLKAGGFEAQPVLVSTRANGFPSEEIPAITDFNALVVKLDLGETSYLLDAANKHLPFGMIREELINGNGRVLDFKNGSYWYPMLQRSAYSRRTFQAFINIAGNNARVREISNGYYALEKREKLANMSAEAYEDELANELERKGDYTLISFENSGIEHPEKSVTSSYELELNRDLSSDRILINPFILNAYGSNPFKLHSRTYPVDFGYPLSVHYVIMLQLGDDYELEDKPGDLSITLPANTGKLQYNITQSGEQVTVSLQMDIFNPLIHPDHYKELKEFFNEFVSLQTKKPITLVRQPKSVSENDGK